MRQRIVLVGLLAALVASSALAELSRVPASGVTVRLAKVPDRQGKVVDLDEQGRFRLANPAEGTWTLTVSAPKEYLEKWVAAELKKRNWTRGPAPEKEVQSESTAARGNDAVQGAKTEKAPKVPSESVGSRAYRIVAHDADGRNYALTFGMVAVVEGVKGDDRAVGRYEKPMRWQQLEKGLSFKFYVGKEAGGAISGSVERMLTVE